MGREIKKANPDALNYCKQLGANVIVNDTNNLELEFYHVDLEEQRFATLASFTNIVSMVFYVSNVSDQHIAHLTNCAGLSKLGFISCARLTDKSIDMFSSMKQLRDLAFIDCKISKDALDKLISLQPKIQVHYK